MARRAPQIIVTPRQARLLVKLVRAHSTSQQLLFRVRIVQRSALGMTNKDQAAEFGTTLESIHRWRNRWLAGQEKLAAAEAEDVSDLELERMIVALLSDRVRSGAPPRFTPYEIAQVFALACEEPGESGVPLSHWTPGALAHELQRRRVVDSISPRQIERFLKGGRHPASSLPQLAASHT